ncbi:hypothetical protein AN960_13125 [Bacillus sp. FJAT-25509]|uniref:hypothetical protein n=1 Tax=Bacillus sp. FJAT-25509 TaxID=1712029 RepID=UPI0006FEB3E7|nr:hypothetical protein [Bacillus sp. FJAT-25509]KQL38287.1 hypothetical protein AN960_13125 [Bacillus sp. FJAT-25509]
MRFTIKAMIAIVIVAMIALGFYFDMQNVKKNEKIERIEKRAKASAAKVSKPDPNPLVEHKYGTIVRMYIREGHLHIGDHVRAGFTNYSGYYGAHVYVELRNKDDKLIDIQHTGLGDYANNTIVFRELKETGEYHLDITIGQSGGTKTFPDEKFRYDGIIVD